MFLIIYYFLQLLHDRWKLHPDGDDDEASFRSESKLLFNEDDDAQFQAYADSISKILDDSRRSMQMDRCYSYSDLLKLRYNYDKIVTGTSGVERGSNRTFYPVYNKFMYLLDKNALKYSFNTNGNTNNNSRATSPTAAQIPLNSAGQQQSVHRYNRHIQ